MSRPSRSGASTRRAAARGWLTLLTVLLGVLGALGLGAPPALAASPEVTVTIGAMTPAVLTTTPAASQRLSITGTLANTSTENLTSVQVYLWRDTTPLTTAAAVTSYLTSAQTTPVGARALESVKATIDEITSDDQPTLVPGQSASFSVSAQANLLGLRTPGSYPVGVQVRAQRPGHTDFETVGRARTMVTVLASSTTSLQYSPLVELTSTPSLLAGTTFADGHLATELTGRLDRLLSLAEQAGSTVAVDPGLVDEVEALRQVHTISGTTLTASQQAAQRRAATLWLARLAKVVTSHRSYRLPYADADLTLALAANDTDARDRVAAAVQSDNLVAKLPLAIIPRTRTTSQALLAFVRPLKPAVVFTSDAADGIDTASGLKVRSLVGNVLAGGPSPAPTGTTVQLRSILLADAALAQRAGRLPVVVPVSTDADLGVVTGVSGSATPVAVSLPSQGSAQLPAMATLPDATSWSTAVASALDSFSAWGELTSQQADATVQADQTLARSMAASWTTPQQGLALLSATVRQVGDVLHGDQVSVSMAREFVLSSSTNVLPATVNNALTHSVRVRMSFTSENPQRLQVPVTQVVTVGPGDHATLHFTPQASTNGAVVVLAQLQTAEGHAIGSPIRITVRATSFGRVGWIIVVASGVVFMGMTTLRIRQVQRERAAQRASRHEAAVRAVRLADAAPSGHTGDNPTGVVRSPDASGPAGPGASGTDGAGAPDHGTQARSDG